MQPVFFGSEDANVILLQPTDTHEEPLLQTEYDLICSACSDDRILLAAFRIDDWNCDLSPWPAPPVFGKEGFDGGAAQTLSYVKDEFLPCIREKLSAPERARYLIGGYSLAALFALYACYETLLFSACAAASPSVWFPDWLAYAEQHAMQADAVYLSLGDREPRAKNPTMARVGDCIEAQEKLLVDAGKTTTLEWNKGGHFKDSEKRTAQAFAWCIQHL